MEFGFYVVASMRSVVYARRRVNRVCSFLDGGWARIQLQSPMTLQCRQTDRPPVCVSMMLYVAAVPSHAMSSSYRRVSSAYSSVSAPSRRPSMSPCLPAGHVTECLFGRRPLLTVVPIVFLRCVAVRKACNSACFDYLATSAKLLAIAAHTLFLSNPEPPSPTQPPTLSGTGNEYPPKCSDALRLGSKGRMAHSTCG